MRKDPIVLPGQVYEDCDKRMHGRRVRVVEIITRSRINSRYGSYTEKYAVCECAHAGRRLAQPIRCDRMYPHSTGWRLVEDVPAKEAL